MASGRWRTRRAPTGPCSSAHCFCSSSARGRGRSMSCSQKPVHPTAQGRDAMDRTERTTAAVTTAVSSQALGELTRLFLRLGFPAFGGPAAHIAMMKEEVVTRRRWLTEAEFLDLLGATNLIPGPNSTEMAMHIGLRQGGWRGLLLAGSCFTLPAVFIVSAFAWAYGRFGSLPAVAGLLY